MAVKYSTKTLVKRFGGRSGGLQFVTADPLEPAREATRRPAIEALPEMTYAGPGGTLARARRLEPTLGGPRLHIDAPACVAFGQVSDMSPADSRGDPPQTEEVSAA